jgi:hypothetical protein
MPFMNNTGSPVPDSRRRTCPGGDAMSIRRSCTSSPLAAATRRSVARSRASIPMRRDGTSNGPERRVRGHAAQAFITSISSCRRRVESHRRSPGTSAVYMTTREGSQSSQRRAGVRSFCCAARRLCSWCATGHEPRWMEFPEPDWSVVGCWLMRSRPTRWIFGLTSPTHAGSSCVSGSRDNETRSARQVRVQVVEPSAANTAAP